MADAQETQQVVEALALTGATTLVTAMATDFWQAVRTGTARLFRHRGDGARGIEDNLDEDAAVVANDPTGKNRRVLIARWRIRLLALLCEHPEAVDELRRLVDEVDERLPGDRETWTMKIDARGRAVVNAVQRGRQYNIHMDTPPSPDRQEGEEIT